MKHFRAWGLNRVDMHAPDYSGWDGALRGCVNDVAAMAVLAAQAGFEVDSDKVYIADYQGETVTIGGGMPNYELKGEATRATFRHTFAEIASSDPGDIWFLWYSGHGSQSKYAFTRYEGFCFFDGVLWDRDFWGLCSAIPAGVRVFMGSDSCHSGGQVGTRARGYYSTPKACPIPFQQEPVKVKKGIMQGNLCFWAGCLPDQFSMDGPQNGQFTTAVIGASSQQHSYQSWAKAVEAIMPSTQIPEMQFYGPGGAAVWGPSLT